MIALRLLTEISSWPALGGDHHILEFVKRKALAWHVTHGMIKHLSSGIGILDLVP